MRYLVTGAGGFIGGHMVASLLEDGHYVRAVDRKDKDEWWQLHDSAENVKLNLQSRFDCHTAMKGMERVYNLAADMGGIGYISEHKLDPMLSVLINTHLLIEADRAGVDRYLFSSSACVYPQARQNHLGMNLVVSPALHEDEAYPADPEDGYGWEKLFSERMCRHFYEERKLQTRVARLHNVYGPHGSWNDGREKAPAAICRKVAQAIRNDSHAIDVWGDGEQTRSFMYVDDCIHGLKLIMANRWHDPVNLGSSELVTVNQLVSHVEHIAGTSVHKSYLPDMPQGVRGRNSDNTLIRDRYDWEPSTSLHDGLVPTYEWIAEQLRPKERSDWPMPAWGRAGT